MSNKALIRLFNSLLLSTVCVTAAVANTAKPVVDSVQIEKLTQSIASGVITKLSLSDQDRPELQTMSLDKIVSEALHAGKPIEEIRKAVSETMEELTGKPLGHFIKDDTAQPPQAAQAGADASLVESEVGAENVAAESGEERTIPLTTVLLPNESLSSVAKRIYGPDQGRRYLDIYEFNKDIIKNINVIPEGTELKLPQ